MRCPFFLEWKMEIEYYDRCKRNYCRYGTLELGIAQKGWYCDKLSTHFDLPEGFLVPICQECYEITLSETQEKEVLEKLFAVNSFEMWYRVFSEFNELKSRLREVMKGV